MDKRSAAVRDEIWGGGDPPAGWPGAPPNWAKVWDYLAERCDPVTGLVSVSVRQIAKQLGYKLSGNAGGNALRPLRHLMAAGVLEIVRSRPAGGKDKTPNVYRLIEPPEYRPGGIFGEAAVRPVGLWDRIGPCNTGPGALGAIAG